MPVRDDLEASAALARSVELLCETRPGVPVGALVELALASPPHCRVTAKVVRTGSDRVAVVWVEKARPHLDVLLGPLTPREREVALLLAEGARNREVAARLKIAEATVKDHVHRALDKLGCESRAELVAMLARAE